MARSNSGPMSRRQFLHTAAAGTAATAVAPAVITAGKTDARVVTGEGDFQYQVIHQWPQLPDDFRWQTTHNVTVDAAGHLTRCLFRQRRQHLRCRVGRHRACHEAQAIGVNRGIPTRFVQNVRTGSVANSAMDEQRIIIETNHLTRGTSSDAEDFPFVPTRDDRVRTRLGKKLRQTKVVLATHITLSLAPFRCSMRIPRE